MENFNTKRLASLLANRMKETSNAAVRTTLELGRYNKDHSITPDSLRVKIPKGEYMINFMFRGDVYTAAEVVSLSGGGHAQEGGSGEHVHTNDGEHTHRLPTQLLPLKEGDRILIAWCGTEPVVIAKVVKG